MRNADRVHRVHTMGCTAPSQAARHVAGVAVAAAWLSLAACHDEHWLSYPWDDRQIFCSLPVDDLSTAPDWDLVDEQLDVAARTNAVALMHAHKPGTTISIAGIERVLTMADQRHLPFLTYRELEAGAAPQAGLALAFDDSSIIEWYGIRDQLAAHRAHITLFITRWHSRSDEERAMVRTMADEGDDIEPHSVEHLDPIDYVHDHGIDAYMADEVIPSFDALTQAGYPAATIYAYPFGRSTDELNSAVLRIVPRVRVSPGSCPY